MSDVEDLWEEVRFAADDAAIDAAYGPGTVHATQARITEAAVKAAFRLALEQGLIVVTPQSGWPDVMLMRAGT